MKVGEKVITLQEIDRFPHFIIKQHATGTITKVKENEIWVKFDQKIEGCEEWDNQVLFDTPGIDRLHIAPKIL